MKKKLVSLMAVLTMLCAFVPTVARAVTSGTCGDNVTWTLNDDGILNISGIGDMQNYDWNSSPFFGNETIKTVVIDKGVTSIGNHAFYNCQNLTNINISNSVTNIGEFAFESCDSLTNLTLPNSVTSIGNRAMSWCDNLTNIYIPSSVISIGNGAFEGCQRLSSINIPNSVISIGDMSFYRCDNLTNIIVEDSNRYYKSVDGALLNKSETEIICYPSGRRGSYTITNNVMRIRKNAFNFCDGLTNVVIPNSVTSIGAYAFASCHNLISVTIPTSLTSIESHAFYNCDRLEQVYYGGSKATWNTIKIESYNSCLKYATIHCKDGIFGNTNSTSNGAPIITAAQVEGVDGTYDLFNDKLNVTKDSDIAATSYAVSGTVDANGCKDVHLYITQGSKSAIEIPLDSSKSIQLGKEFSVGQPIYMTAIDKKTGKSSTKRTKLSVVDNGMFEGELSGGAIKIIEDFFVDIPDGVPVLENQTIGLSLGSVSSEVEIDGNEFKVAVGTDFLEGKKDSDGLWQKEAWNGFKKGFKDAAGKQVTNAERYLHMKKALKQLGGKMASMTIKSGVSGGANVTGYIEGYIDGSGLHPSEGGIIVNAEIKYTYQGMVVVVVVPMYYEIGAGGEVTFVGGVKDLVPGNGLQGAWTGSITPAVFFEVGGGFGVPLIFTVGASGKVKAELEIALNKIYQKLDVTGTANFKLEGPFGHPTYKKPFASGTFHIYETGNKNTLLGKAFNLYSVDEAKQDNPYAQIDIDAPITIAEHGDNIQEWVGDETQINLMAVDYTNQDVKVLEKDSYENIAPVFAEMDGKNVIAWITDNKARADGDKNMLVYSVEENGTWSAPKAVYDDGFADSTPAMKDGYIVWQKATQTITSDMTSRDLGKVCEIYLAKWNGDGFDTPVKVTANALLDQTTLLAVNNGVATTVWVQNSDNNFMGTTGENKIMSYTNGTTKTEATVSDAITNISAAYIDGTLNIAYETDSDKDLSTLEDREIYNAKDGTISRITNNSLIDTHPVYSDFEGKTTLFYYSDGKIVYLKDGVENTVIDSGVVTDQFTAISNGNTAAVLWTAVNDGSAELHGALYDGSEWSEDVQVSDLGARIKFPSAVMKSDGSIFAAFNRTEKIPNEYYYDDGKSDLCTISINPSYDIEITDAYFDEDSMTAYATVKNSGELEISSYTVAFTGNNVAKITEPLKAGESTEIELTYNKPQDLTVSTIDLTVSIDDEEYNTDNNKVSFEIGHADIVVDNVVVNEDETVVSADVSNTGYTNAENVTVSLRDGGAEGAVIATKTMSIAVDDKKSVTFDIDKSDLRFMDATKTLYVTASIDEDEVSLGNNDGYVLITSVSGYADYEIEVLDYNEIDGKYVINSVARNNTNSETPCKLYTAVYSSDGHLKGCGSVDADIEADNDTGVDVTVSCNIEETDIIKTFMWGDTMTPLTKAKKFIIE